MSRLVFKLLLTSHNAPTVLAWMAAAVVALLALQLVASYRRAARYARGERERQAHLARWRELAGCDPRCLTSEQIASITQRAGVR